MTNATLFHRNRRDFSEFLLHHIITLVLVVYTYMGNCIPVGAGIMLTTDISDIFVALFKISVDVNEIAQKVLYLTMFASWGYFRMFYYPVY